MDQSGSKFPIPVESMHKHCMNQEENTKAQIAQTLAAEYSSQRKARQISVELAVSCNRKDDG